MNFNSKALILTTFLAFSLLSNVSLAADNLYVKLHFHIVKDIEMVKNGTRMTGYISKSNIKNAILDDINETWAPADIIFKVSSVNYRESLDYDKRESDISGILERELGQSNPMGKIERLIDRSKEKSYGINIWIFPYMGEGNQGDSTRDEFWTVAGRYSDKMNRGEKPQKAKITESRPFDIGSMARTIAHEIGHVLQLNHHDEELDGSGHLMGGEAKHGYNLTDDEIETARETILNTSRL